MEGGDGSWDAGWLEGETTTAVARLEAKLADTRRSERTVVTMERTGATVRVTTTKGTEPGTIFPPIDRTEHKSERKGRIGMR